MATPRIALIRHGQTTWSKSGQHTSTTDLPLLPEGEEQASNLRKSLAGRRFVDVWVSPRLRALRTAELAGMTPTRIVDDLVEVDYGGYEGRTTLEIRAELGRPWTLWEDGTIPGDASPGERAAALHVPVTQPGVLGVRAALVLVVPALGVLQALLGQALEERVDELVVLPDAGR